MKKEIRSILSVIDKTTILSIIIISSIVNLLMLVIPVAIQTLVNIVAFGKMLRPVFTLGTIVFVLMIGIAILNVWQSIIIEIIRQKCMVKLSFDLTDLFTKFVSPTKLESSYRPDLVNRFFEISTINKSLTSLLIYGTNLSLQTVFGLTLLALYHPFFLLFDAFVLIGITLIIIWPYRLALLNAKEECTQKHRIAVWLEEIFNNKLIFNFLSYDKFAKKQTDKELIKFLKTRNLEFRQLIKHQIGLFTLAAISMSMLLCLGGYLVIQNQLSLGQLVAAEIIYSMLIYGFKDIFTVLENYYDLRASLIKIKDLTISPQETTVPKATENFFLEITQLHLNIKDKLDATALRAQPLLIHLDKREDAFLLTKELFGFSPLSFLKVKVNGVACSQDFLRAIRSYSLVVTNMPWFMGTIYENLVLNKKNVSNESIYQYLEDFNLLHKTMELPHGLHTTFESLEKVFTLSELTKLSLIRARVAQPQLLLLDCIMDIFDKKEGEDIISLLLEELENSIIIIITQSNFFPFIKNRVALTS